MAKESQIRQNYYEECEALVNKQINLQLHTSYVFLSMYSYFNRDDQAPPGFAVFCKTVAEEERRHGTILMEYQTKRGGRLVLQDVTKPITLEWGTPLDALTAVLEIEKKVNQALLELQKCATTKGDFHLVNFIGDKFLTKMKTVGTGLGVHIVDRDLNKICQTGFHFENYKNYIVEEDVAKIKTNEGNYWNVFNMEKILL